MSERKGLRPYLSDLTHESCEIGFLSWKGICSESPGQRDMYHVIYWVIIANFLFPFL